MKSNLLSILLLFISVSLFAQRPQGNWGGGKKGGGPSITGKLTGKIIDETTKEPVAFATIVLLKPGETKEVNGNISDEDGKFKLTDVKLGKYDIQISFIGYKTRMFAGVEFTPKKPDVDLETITLISDNVLLDAVEVVEEAALVENRIDKIVYNADKDVTSAGGDAADVLRKVPLLAVDFDGNVSLRGSSNLQILINGKPSSMFSGSVADALKMMPADQIKSVEVITTPTAKYDGEGSGGIINIITKKKNIEGFSGNVNTSVGNPSNRGSLNINAAKGRFGITGTGSVFYSLPREGTSEFRRTDLFEGNTRTFNQFGTSESSYLRFRGSGGAFYDINAYNSINSSFSFGGYSSDSEGLNEVFFEDPSRDFLQEYTRSAVGTRGYNSFDWTTDYRKTFPQKERELSFAFQLSGNNQDNDNDYDQISISNAQNFEERGRNDGKNREYTFQVDYVHPFSDAIKLEVGAKSVLRRINSDYSYTVISGPEETPFISDVFNYDQDVMAGYASLNVKIGKDWGLIAGARYEDTDIRGMYEVDGNSFENDYDNLLPSIIISKKLKKFQTLKASYTKRIQRPSLFYINPYADVSDRRNVSLGNPLLAPETVEQYEVSYNTFIKGIVVNAAVYYRHTDDIIESFLTVNNEGVSITSYNNIGKNNSVGFNVYSSAKLFKRLTIRGNFNMFSYNVEGFANGEAVSRKAAQYNGRISGTIDLGKGFKMEGFTFINSRRQTVQGEIAAFRMYSLAFKKDLWDKKGSIGISSNNPFTKWLSFTNELEGTNFNQFSDRTILFRSFMLSFGYRFGKLDFNSKRKRSKIKNTDLKSGEGNNNY